MKKNVFIKNKSKFKLQRRKPATVSQLNLLMNVRLSTENPDHKRKKGL